MQMNRKKISFHWKKWIISLCMLFGMGSVGLVSLECFEVKAADYSTFAAALFEQMGEKVFIIAGDINEDSYSITYDPNGGSGNMPVSIITGGIGNLAQNSFTRTGYTFTGWATSAGGGVIYKDGATFYPTSDMTLYAVWEEKKHAVFLEETGDNASGSSEAVSYGSTVSLNAGTKQGYTFAGWTVKSGGITLADASSEKITFVMPDADVRLCANWTINSYQVTVSEGGQGGTDIITAQYQSTVTIQAGTKEGHTFDGWEVESGTVVLADASSPITTFVVGTSDIKLKAHWQVNGYTFTAANIGDGTAEKQKINYGDKVQVNAGSRNGCYFCGWEITEGLASLENPLNQEVSFLMPASDVEITAIWKDITEVKAEVNSRFHNEFDTDTYYKDGRYNINKNICITKDLLDVTIGFSDGSASLAKISDYDLGNQKIDQLGKNEIEIILTAGNTGLTFAIPLIGYSPELDAVMQELGLTQGDYSGLAARVEQIQTETHKLNTDIAKYEQNLSEIKKLLAEADIETDLTGELEERLKNTQNSVKEAAVRLNQMEEEFIKINTILTEIGNTLGADHDECGDYKNLSDILKKLQEEIEKTKKNEVIVMETINQIAEQLGIYDRISSPDLDLDFLKEVIEKIDQIKADLDLYKKTMDQLKDTFEIVNTGSLESQLDEILIKIQQKLAYLDDIKNEIERQLKGDYGEVNTEGMQQAEAIFARIYAIKAYADNLKQFQSALKGLLGLDSSSTKEDIYQTISNLKEKVAEYDKFLNQAEALIDLKEGNGSSELVTGVQTKEELDKLYVKMEEIVEQVEFLNEILQVLLEREDISAENKEELEELLVQLIRQKETANQFVNRLKELLEMNPQASAEEVYRKISDMKDTMIEYWEYLGSVEHVIQIEDGSHVASGSSIVTGPAVTGRLTNIYEKLTDMVKQQDRMSQTIEQLLEKAAISSEIIKELQETLSELNEQKQQANQYLEELKKLLNLKDSAGYKEVIYTVTDLKEQLKNYISIIGKLMQQFGMTPEGGEQGEQRNLPEQLETILNKVMELIHQLTEQAEKSEEAEKTKISLEQKVKVLSIENQEAESENSKLKTEIEKLRKELSFSLANSSGSSDSSDSFSSADWDNLEKKNRLQQERIAELEKQLQTQAEEMKNILSERKQLLEGISDKDREIVELKEQVEKLTLQLAEKENRIKDLEEILESQKPMQELLGKNQIDYTQLVQILSNRNQSESGWKNQVVKDAEEEEQLEEAVVQKEKREDLKTATAEPEETEVILEETEGDSDSEQDDSIANTDTESERESELEERQEEEHQDRIGGNWAFLVSIIVVLLLVGAVVFVLCGKNNLKR